MSELPSAEDKGENSTLLQKKQISLGIARISREGGDERGEKLPE
jgi:hypothetical protein